MQAIKLTVGRTSKQLIYAFEDYISSKFLKNKNKYVPRSKLHAVELKSGASATLLF